MGGGFAGGELAFTGRTLATAVAGGAFGGGLGRALAGAFTGALLGRMLPATGKHLRQYRMLERLNHTPVTLELPTACCTSTSTASSIIYKSANAGPGKERKER